MNEYKTENEARTPGTDVSNHGAYRIMTMKADNGNEIKFRLYGR